MATKSFANNGESEQVAAFCQSLGGDAVSAVTCLERQLAWLTTNELASVVALCRSGTQLGWLDEVKFYVMVNKSWRFAKTKCKVILNERARTRSESENIDMELM